MQRATGQELLEASFMLGQVLAAAGEHPRAVEASFRLEVEQPVMRELVDDRQAGIGPPTLSATPEAALLQVSRRA